METFIWIIAIFAVILIVVIYIITSVGSYSDSFKGRFFKEKSDSKSSDDKKN